MAGECQNIVRGFLGLRRHGGLLPARGRIPRIGHRLFLACCALITGTILSGQSGPGVAWGGVSVAGAEEAPLAPILRDNRLTLKGKAAPATEVVPYTLLSIDDVDRYRTIFELQERANFTEADKLIALLNNRVLMGHVRFQRLMHPTAYRATYNELADWLEQYGDHPEAKRVFKLAQRRRPRSTRAPERPDPIAGRVVMRNLDYTRPYKSSAPRSRDRAKEVRNVRTRLKTLVEKGNVSMAARLLDQPDVNLMLDAVETDIARQWIAAGYYHYAMYDKALAYAERAAGRSGEAIPLAHWYAGLSAWRMEDFAKAADHFEAVPRSDQAGRRLKSAGAYWAARSYLKLHDPGHVVDMLTLAAKHPRTFYGLLANRALGQSIKFDWTMPKPKQSDLAELSELPGALRAVALVQVGRADIAEEEMRLLYGRTGWELDPLLIGLAEGIKLPGAMLRLGAGSFNLSRHIALGNKIPHKDPSSVRHFDAALYPIPPWKAPSGFVIDQALIWAIVRNESRFRPDAQSGSKAKGLMQLIPSTASYIARRNNITNFQASQLFDPAFNLKIGQLYIKELLDHPRYNQDLFQVIAAYNAGPGNVYRWQRRTGAGDDPLLFIESLPSSETRAYIERVMTDFWIYRIRLGQPTPTLDAVVSGGSPLYARLDSTYNPRLTLLRE